MSKALLMGIDIGTSGCKTILIDDVGNVVDSVLDDYPLYALKHGWSEQHPQDWWRAVKNTIQKIVRNNQRQMNNLKGIGLSGQMHGLVALDRNNAVIRPSMLWNDQRTGPQCHEIYEKVGGIEGLLKYTNNRMLPGYTGGKILWIRENEPENYEKIQKFLNPKDYIRYCLTGEFATEVSDASGTGLFNVEARQWSWDLLSRLDIPHEWVPKCYESPEISGTIAEHIAAELGLPQHLPVVGGGGDAVIQTLGTGVTSSDVLTTTIGTAGIISTALEEFHANPEGKLQIFCNVMPDKWHVMGVTLAAGGSLRWGKEVFGHSEIEVAKLTGENVYAIISQEATQSKPGANNTIFLPYLVGERCPYADPKARGAFIGISLTNTKADFFRSILEGVIFSFRDVSEILNTFGKTFRHIRTSGGGAQSELWRQIHADIFKKDVLTVSGSREGTAYGAAMVAGVGLKVWTTFEEAANLLQVETKTEPIDDHYEVYDRLYRLYRSYYQILKPSFDEMDV
jgi:xylulokinase